MFRWLFTVFLATMFLSAAWPWLDRLGIGRLPGDVRLRWRGRQILLPFASTVMLSLIGSALVRWL